MEALAGLVVARRPHEAGRGGELVPFVLVAPRLDLVAHAGPFLEPGMSSPTRSERAADAVTSSISTPLHGAPTGR